MTDWNLVGRPPPSSQAQWEEEFEKYNSFPKFADKWIPEDLLTFSPVLRNITENPTCVQFDHRILGILSLTVITATALKAAKTPGLPPHIRTAALAMGAMGWMQ